MSRFADNPVIVPDRELAEEKDTRSIGTAHSLPDLRLVATERRQMVLRVWSFVEYFRHGRHLPSLRAPMG